LVPRPPRFSRPSSPPGRIPKGFRTCLGVLSLTRSYDNARVDAACRRGILIKARSVASIRSILKNGLDRAFLDETSDRQPLHHGNIRGQGYFH
jgi:transposase